MLEELEIRSLRTFISNVYETYDYDLKNYAQAPLKHRIITFSNAQNIADADVLNQQITEQQPLYNAFLNHLIIDTTEMFRDPSFWRALRDEVCIKFKTLPSIRIWMHGCNTGLELYSLLILLEKEGLRHKTSILATDIDDQVLLKAQEAELSLPTFEQAQTNWKRIYNDSDLSSFFTAGDDAVTLAPDLLQIVKFKRLRPGQGETPPQSYHYTHCRNVMIYFNASLQEKMQDMLLDSLFPKGFLAIGGRENMIGHGCKQRCTAINTEERIFCRI